jgi:hypothetical protein
VSCEEADYGAPYEEPHGTCDWGGCDEVATRWRWSPRCGWLPTCEECFRKPRLRASFIAALILCHEKDAAILPACVASVRRLAPYRIQVLSRARPAPERVGWIQQDNMTPTLAQVEKMLPDADGCARWYLQQILKLTAPMPGPRWLQVDADIVFQRHVEFLDEEGRALFSPYCAPHFHWPYFEHMARLVPGLKPQTSQSLISHHLLYERDILDSLIAEVEAHHKRPFWEAYLACVDPAFVTKSGAAENELYSHYALWRFPDRCRVRPLKFEELNRSAVRPDLDFISLQAYNRA